MLINVSGLFCGSLGRATLKLPSIRFSSMERLALPDETRSPDSDLWLFSDNVSSLTTAYYAFSRQLSLNNVPKCQIVEMLVIEQNRTDRQEQMEICLQHRWQQKGPYVLGAERGPIVGTGGTHWNWWRRFPHFECIRLTLLRQMFPNQFKVALVPFI